MATCTHTTMKRCALLLAFTFTLCLAADPDKVSHFYDVYSKDAGRRMSHQFGKRGRELDAYANDDVKDEPGSDKPWDGYHFREAGENKCTSPQTGPFRK